MEKKQVIICVDGLGPDYLKAAPTPNIDHMAREGSFSLVESAIPSVTNVNNVSILTGVYPELHGITSNCYLDMETGRETFMESPHFICHSTILQIAKSKGKRNALLTSKKKLLQLLNLGTDYSLAAEDPDEDMIQKIGPPPNIYSPKINLWLLMALRVVLKELDPDLVYCSTTDYVMHKYPPEHGESIGHVQGLDKIVGRILEDDPSREIYVTADHGMSAKTTGIDLEKALEFHGIFARAIPIIKDRYVVHHGNLGGAAYVYLKEPAQTDEALDILQNTRGIEGAYSREEAAKQFHLMESRIGDVFVLGDKDTVFGSFNALEVPVEVRSHGSRHESLVPLIVYGGDCKASYKKNFDFVVHLST